MRVENEKFRRKKIRDRRKGAQQRALGIRKFQTRIFQIKKSWSRKIRQGFR